MWSVSSLDLLQVVGSDKMNVVEGIQMSQFSWGSVSIEIQPKLKPDINKSIFST